MSRGAFDHVNAAFPVPFFDFHILASVGETLHKVVKESCNDSPCMSGHKALR
jgi:hypothetical protein